ncbi:hypothetical protein [Bradyrhizobium ottawaense]
MAIKRCVNCGGPFDGAGQTCGGKCAGDVAEKALAAAALDFFNARVVGPGGLDHDVAKKALHDLVDEAYIKAVDNFRSGFKLI